MRARRLKRGDWSLRFEQAEAEDFVQSLRALAGNYRVDGSDLPEKLQYYRQGRIARDNASKPDDEIADAQADLEAERSAWRSERLPYLEKWLETFEQRRGKGWTLRLTTSELDLLMAMTNDRRLMLAVEHDVDAELMESEIAAISDVAKRNAIIEIRQLEYVMRFCMALLESVEEEWQEDESAPGDVKEITLNAMTLFGSTGLPTDISQEEIMGAINDMLQDLHAVQSIQRPDQNSEQPKTPEADSDDEDLYEITEEDVARWDEALAKFEAGLQESPDEVLSSLDEDEEEDFDDDDFDDEGPDVEGEEWKR